MFDRFTNSNAESEHSVLKKKSIGIQANGSFHQLYQLSEMEDARRCHCIKCQTEHSNLTKTDVKSLCPLSSYLTKYCFNKMEHRFTWAKQCISKQVSKSKWLVVYLCEDCFDANEVNSFLLPDIKRICEVSRTTDGHLSCS